MKQHSNLHGLGQVQAVLGDGAVATVMRAMLMRMMTVQEVAGVFVLLLLLRVVGPQGAAVDRVRPPPTPAGGVAEAGDRAQDGRARVRVPHVVCWGGVRGQRSEVIEVRGHRG